MYKAVLDSLIATATLALLIPLTAVSYAGDAKASKKRDEGRSGTLVSEKQPTKGRGKEYGAEKKGKGHRFVGVSKRGSFEEALNDALRQLKQALSESGISDNEANWRLVEVTGRVGTIVGLNELRVTISAKFETRNKPPKP